MTHAPAFPSGASVSELEVYSSTAPDGLAGGTPHLHTVASEAYLVIAGAGELHAVDASGASVTPLTAGDTVWFTPGVVHRAVNLGGLRVRVVMSHAGLPEAGDAVMTFPDDVLADPEAYAAAAALPGPESSHDARLAAAARRRDLAVEGYAALAPGGVVDPDALARLYRRAVALVRPRIGGWTDTWRRAHEGATRATETQLAALAQGEPGSLAAGRIGHPQTSPAYGMCGLLTTIAYEGEL
ncbi:cupin domain-containing protein [Demequina sp. NBRC 110057]|uniref:cupin domain-containing protein n=1 Tax=Demequina sp. NBRC 110057 TaxID=1570346 RepID=UPI000A067538|nr:cupin domain-containing protein [Demequina sp. NBRC 110057]